MLSEFKLDSRLFKTKTELAYRKSMRLRSAKLPKSPVATKESVGKTPTPKTTTSKTKKKPTPKKATKPVATKESE